MTNKTVIFFLIIYLLMTWGCAGPSATSINNRDLSPGELEKVQTVKVIEDEKELNELSYKIIQKIKGLSCTQFEIEHTGFLKGNKIKIKPTREKAVEQLKRHAVKAESNAIANIACIHDIDRYWGCLEYFECEADAIQLD